MNRKSAAELEAADLAGLVRHVLQESGQPASRISVALGRSPRYLDHVLSGGSRLRMKVVFEVLEAIGAHPGAFFDRHYPLGGWRASAWVEGAGTADGRTAPELGELLELAEKARPVPGAAALLDRTSALLRAKLAHGRKSLRQASLALDLGPAGLAKVFRRPERLAAWHLFGLLADLEMTPARYFAELFSPREVAPVVQRDVSRLLDALEGLLANLRPAKAG